MTIFFIKKLSKDLLSIVKRHIFASLLVDKRNALRFDNLQKYRKYLINKQNDCKINC